MEYKNLIGGAINNNLELKRYDKTNRIALSQRNKRK